MATKKRASVYMLRATESARLNMLLWHHGSWIGGGWATELSSIHPTWCVEKAKVYKTREDARHWRRVLRRAGMRTEIVRFKEVR